MEPARDPFEELTSLYLGEPSSTPGGSSATSVPSPRGHAGPMRITVAVCGNLPVMAGIWVTQYADLEAARSGPTALVRLDGGRCSFELLRPRHEPVRFDGQAMPEAAASLVGDIRRWIVCVDDRDAAAAVRAGADELVVLTSADQLALVEAYRLIKAARARAVDPSSLDLGVVIAGANEKTSDRAAALLDEMSSRHLGTHLPVIAMVRRLDVVEHSHRIAFEESRRGDPADVVAALLEADVDVVDEPADDDAETRNPIAGSADPEASAADPTGDVDGPALRLRLADADSDADVDHRDDDHDEGHDDVEGLLRHLDDLDASLELEVDPDFHEFDAIFGDAGRDDLATDPDPRPASSPGSSSARGRSRAFEPERQRPRPPSPIRLGPAPAQAVDRPTFIDLDDLDASVDPASRIGPGRGEAREPVGESPATVDVAATPRVVEAKPTPGDLLSVVDGVTPVDWPFISAEGVQCGVDARGRLHLVCRDHDHGQLEIARQWAVGQRGPLAKVAGVAEDAVTHPVLHVVTDHPPRVANLHRTGVHLHLLVETDGRRTIVPLNDDATRDMP